MKRLFYLLIPAVILISCNNKPGDKAEELIKLKKERSDLDAKIKGLEAGKKDSGKVTPVSVAELQLTSFNAYVEVQSQINGDENVLATPQAPGMVRNILVKVGQRVSKGQVLATLDASTMEHNIDALSPQLSLTKSLYDKQKNLWSQNIGTEVQLMTAKTNYESVQKQIEAAKSQRDLYRITSPITGVVDAVTLKEGEVANPGMSGIKVVSFDKLKAEATLGENYLGKVKQGNPVTLIFPDMNDSINTRLTYVSQAVDPLSRAITVQVQLSNNVKLHPNMSCIMRISNYENQQALLVPVSVIQKTPNGDMLYIADGDKAKSVYVKLGQNSNGMVEVLNGLNAGDQVITLGFEDLNDGDPIAIQK